MENKELIDLALKVKENAYSPYFNFKVGAAVVTKSGKVYTGCNIENGAGFSICAERVAISKAISEGELEFSKIAVVGDKEDSFTFPCGVCRQFMSEFNDKIEVILQNKDEIKSFNLSELLPYIFKL